jgi:two-component system LytT family response regulator
MGAQLSLRALVVDDEQYVRVHLSDLLEERSEVGSISEATHGSEAIKRIREDEPDLVFLDVQMPTKSGIEVVREVGPEAMPATVFVTAYDEYAIEAFELSAVDYLLKPFDEERFDKGFERAVQVARMDQVEDLAARFQDLLDVSGQRITAQRKGDERTEDRETEETEYLERITVEARGQIHIVPVKDIRYVTAEDMYVKIHTAENSHLLRERLYEMEKRLDPSEFVRIHRSTIVRMDCIDRLVQRAGGDYVVQLEDAKRFRVSRGRQDELIRRLEKGA